MTPKVKPSVGQIVAIPVAEGRYVLAQLLFLSTRYRNVALYGFLDAPAQRKPSIPRVLSYRYVCYGSRVSVRSGKWKVAGEAPLAVSPEISRRIVGGDVWVGDRYLRPATDRDYRDLYSMDVCGDRLIETTASTLYIESPSDPLLPENSPEMSAFIERCYLREQPGTE